MSDHGEGRGRKEDEGSRVGEICRDRRLEKKMREGWLRRMIGGKGVDESFSDSTIDNPCSRLA